MNNAMSPRKKKNLELAQLSLLAAILVVLQLLSASLVRVGLVAPTLALVPIILAGAIFGVRGGAILGSVFGLVTFICVITGLDAYTFTLFQEKPLETTLLCFLKAILAGVMGALIYKGCMKLFGRNVIVSTIAASIITPVTNTFVYLLGMAVFLRDLVTNNGVPVYSNDEALITVMLGFFSMIVVNFILEVIVTVICGPVSVGVLSGSRRFSKLFYKK